MTRAKNIKKVAEVPGGYRGVQSLSTFTEKSVRVKYYDWDLIVPRKSVVKCGDKYWVQAWAIDSAKQKEITGKYR
jgi:hypothetical protein